MRREDFDRIKESKEDHYRILSNRRDLNSFLREAKERRLLHEIVKKYTG